MKNIYKLTILLILFIALTISAFGQQFGVTVRGGISRIYGELGTENFSASPYSISPTSSLFSPSFQSGIYYLLLTGKNTSLGTELLYTKVQGGQTNTFDYYFIMQRVAYGTKTTRENISWWSLPVYFGVTMKRLTVNGGFQFSYLLSSSGSVRTNTIQLPKPVDIDHLWPYYGGSSKFDMNNLSIKDVDYGPRIGVVYRLTTKLSIEGMFYYGISNINQLKSSDEPLKIQQMTLGVRYALWTKNDFK